MTGTDEFLARLEDYLDNAEGTTTLPDAARDGIRAELPITRQLGPLWGPLRIFAMATDLPRSTRYALAAVVAVVLLVAASVGVTIIGGPSEPTPLPQPSSSNPTNSLLDALNSAWNSGDGQQAASLYATAPLVRFIVGEGAVTDSFGNEADVEAAIDQWHAQGNVITRTGDLVTEGNYLASTVTWTSSDGTFDGVEVVRTSSDGPVLEQYLIGAAHGTTPQADATKVTNDLRDASNASDASAASTLLTTTVEGRVFRDGTLEGDTPVNRDGMLNGIRNGSACCVTYVGSGHSQGTLIVRAGTLTNDTYMPGAEIYGVEVLEVDSDGQIQYIWRIDTKIEQASSKPSGSQPDA